jgi:hypothetical protein
MAFTTRFGKLVRVGASAASAASARSVAKPTASSNLGANGMPIDKGDLGGSCNRRACLAPGARWFNHSTRRHYCAKCAYELNNDPFNRRDAQEMYGHELCTLVTGT